MKRTFITAAVIAAISVPVLAENKQQTIFGDLDVDKVCIAPKVGGQRALDLHELACHLYDGNKSCGGSLNASDELRGPLRRWLAKNEFGNLQRLLAAPPGRFFRIAHQPPCTTNPPQTAKALVGSTCSPILCDNASRPVATGIELSPALGPVRIRQSPEDFPDLLAATDPASLSLTRNFQNGGNTFAAEAALGYTLEGYLTETPDGRQYNKYSFTPYVGVERVENTGPGQADTTNIYGGATTSLAITNSDWFWGTTHEFIGSARLITDEEADSLIADASLLYKPNPTPDLFTHGVSLGGGPIWLYVDPAMRVDFGRVFDPGTKANLALTEDYLRAGGSVKAVFFDDPDVTDLLDGFSLTLDYTWAHGFAGALDEFQQFEAALRYVFPTQNKNFGIQLRYVNGDVAATLEEKEFLEAAFTVKF